MIKKDSDVRMFCYLVFFTVMLLFRPLLANDQKESRNQKLKIYYSCAQSGYIEPCG